MVVVMVVVVVIDLGVRYMPASGSRSFVSREKKKKGTVDLT